MLKEVKFIVICFICLIFNVFGLKGQNNRDLRSGHSITFSTLYGIEYGYEHAFGKVFHLCGSAGLNDCVYKKSDSYMVSPSIELRLAPRFYMSEEDFFAVNMGSSLIIQGTTIDFSLVPVYGMKRYWSRHWFGEFTIGGGAGYYSGSGLYFKPHLQFNIGFTF